jgi:MFS family permease
VPTSGEPALAAGARTGTAPSPPRTPHPRGHFAVLVLITSVTAIIGSLGNPLIPKIALEHGTSLSSAQWALTASLLTSAVTTPLLGRAASGPRRRPLMLGSLGVVALGGLLTVLPVGFAGLVTGRALQGLGMALVPLVFAVARDLFPDGPQTSAIAWLSVTAVVGSGLGYPITGVAADHFGTAGAFWLGFGVSVATLVVAVFGLPHAPPGAAAPVDWPGGLLLGSGTLGLLLVVTQGEVWGWASPGLLGLLVASAAVLTGCGIWLLRRPNPLVDVRLAVRRGVIAPNLAGALLSAGMFIMFSLTMIVVQHDPATGFGLGRSVTVAGAMLVPYAVGSVVGSRLSLVTGRRIDPDRLLPVGAGLFLAAILVLAFWHSALWQLLVVMLLGGLGSGFSFATLPALVIRHVPSAETGSAMSVNMVLRYLGYAIGSALSLAVLDAFGDVPGEPTPRGFTASALTGGGLCLLALAAAVVLNPRRPVGRRRAVPTVQEGRP